MNTQRKITRLLIANRGEIAVRIMKSAQSLGIHCIALYSDADRDAMHVQIANEAWHVGPSPAKESYLDIEKIMAVAKQANADAVHPGYGFLSENAAFAQTVMDANMIWVGPPVDAIKAMGSKSESKCLMERADVPLVPGYHGDNQDETFLAEQTLAIGFPAVIKASAGGGGKGMRVVNSESELAAAIQAAKREGLNSFGDDKLLVERYVTRPRHVEIQVFMDTHGNGVYLFERDCSIQRRHQKVVEEAPAPQFSQQDRDAMGSAALKAAKAINYVGAGTVEFLFETRADGSNFYFMEMNTRLQVEHPVTEMITGQDLVAWQIKVAQGEALPLKQNELSVHGHSMEVRIYAEDTDNDFLPTTGTLEHLNEPTLIEGRVRLDTGVRQGDTISPYYDPMISKLITWGETRETCLQQMRKALLEYQIAGIKTNLSFLRRVYSVDAFANGDVSTQFIEEHQSQLSMDCDSKYHHVIAAACQHLMQRNERTLSTTNHKDPFSPWNGSIPFRLNQPSSETLSFIDHEKQPLTLVVDHISLDHWTIAFENQQADVKARFDGPELQYEIDGRWYRSFVINHDQTVTVYDADGETQLQYHSHQFQSDADSQGSLTAPMNGTIIETLVTKEQMVKTGDVLIIMEAMKMEHSIKAPMDGVVINIPYSKGDLVNEGALLIEMEEAE